MRRPASFADVMNAGARGCGSSTVSTRLDAAGPGGEDRDAVGQEHRFDQAMGDEDDRLARARELHREIFAEHQPRLFVERGERLVHQQDLGLQRERPRQLRALFHAARELARVVIAKRVQTDGVESFVGARSRARLSARLETPGRPGCCRRR